MVPSHNGKGLFEGIQTRPWYLSLNWWLNTLKHIVNSATSLKSEFKISAVEMKICSDLLAVFKTEIVEILWIQNTIRIEITSMFFIYFPSFDSSNVYQAKDRSNVTIHLMKNIGNTQEQQSDFAHPKKTIYLVSCYFYIIYSWGINQLEKVKAAKSAYLRFWLRLVTFSFLWLPITFPYPYPSLQFLKIC